MDPLLAEHLPLMDKYEKCLHLTVITSVGQTLCHMDNFQ